MSLSQAMASIPSLLRSMVAFVALVVLAGPPAPGMMPPVSVPTADVKDDGQRAADQGEPPKGRKRGRGPLGNVDPERLISVADDISPEWASSLRERFAEDPEAARADFRRYGRRLFGLLMLKDGNPELYKVRVAELALKKGIRDQADRYHAILAKDPVEAERIAGNLKELVVQSVDLELRARALELQALDTAVRELRMKLMTEVTDSRSKSERVLKELLEKPLGEDGPAGPLDGLRPGSFSGDRRPSVGDLIPPAADDRG